MLLVVIDAADPQRRERIDSVFEVLAEIGADNTPILMVFNQIDRLPNVMAHLDHDAQGAPARVWVSAREGCGMEMLRDAIAERVRQGETLPPMRLPARLSLGAVTAESQLSDGSWELSVTMDAGRLKHLCSTFGVDLTEPQEEIAAAGH